MVNKYRVYGLNIESEIEVSEFEKVSSLEGDIIKISYGEMSESIKESIKNNHRIALSREEIWFHIPNVATYRICNGEEITVKLEENTNMQLMKVYLMCSCLGFIMLQRDKVAIHGGVIEMNNKAMIFTGDRGAGKSTLTTALRQKGYKFISDDVAGIEINDIPCVAAGFPYQKLCEDAMENMGYDKEECTSFMSDNQVKYMVPAHDEFILEEKELAGICKLTIGDVEKVEIRELKGKEKLEQITRNIYREEYIKFLGGFSPVYFKKCLKIAQHIKFYEITRPANQFTVDHQIELIEKKVFNYEEVTV